MVVETLARMGSMDLRKETRKTFQRTHFLNGRQYTFQRANLAHYAWYFVCMFLTDFILVSTKLFCSDWKILQVDYKIL